MASLLDRLSQFFASDEDEGLQDASAAQEPAETNDDGRQPQPGLRPRLTRNSNRVSLRRLRATGLREVRLLDLDAVKRVVAESVDEALRLDGRGSLLSPEERSALRDHAQARARDLLPDPAAGASSAEGAAGPAAAPDAAANDEALAEARRAFGEQRQRLEGQLSRLRDEVQEKTDALSDARRKAKQRKLIIEESTYAELAKRLRSTMERLLRDGSLSFPEGSEVVREELIEELTELVSKVIERLREQQDESSGEQVRDLERIVNKLKAALEEKEVAIRRLAAMKMVDPGIASIYDCVQGLNLEDDNYERKSELLKEVFERNLELQPDRGEAEEQSDEPAPAPAPALASVSSEAPESLGGDATIEMPEPGGVRMLSFSEPSGFSGETAF